MFATISEPFFSLFPWQRHDMPGASETGRGDKPFHSHCAKMPSLPSTAILSPANITERRTSHNKTPTFTQPQCHPPPPLLAVFSLQTPEQTLSFMKNMRYRTNLICVGRHMPHTHGGWFRRLFRSVFIFHPWRVGGVRVAVVSPSQWQRLPLQRGRRWTGGKSCPAAAQTNHSTYYTSLLENALRNIQLIFSKIQRECEQFHQ